MGSDRSEIHVGGVEVTFSHGVNGCSEENVGGIGVTKTFCVSGVMIEGHFGGIGVTLDYCVSGLGVRFILVGLVCPAIIVEVVLGVHTDPWLSQGAWWSAYCFMHFC